MKTKLIVSLFLFIGFHALAQLDDPVKVMPGNVFEAEEQNTNTSLSIPDLSANNQGIFKSTNDRSLSEPKEKEFNIQEKNGFIVPHKDFHPKYLKQGNERKMSEKFKNNQYFGDFKSSGKYVQLLCRDHQAIDGDRVRIYVDGKVAVDNVLLEAQFKTVEVPLKKGFNKIEVEALNQGTSGPNTAAFRLYDDKGNLMSSNEWNLATGYKASMIIVKED